MRSARVSGGRGTACGVAGCQPCAEPVFPDTLPYATAKQLVPMEMTGVTPGTEYLLKVNGREVKEGIAESDKVSRKFRMPNLGDKRREARLVVVLANDGCENSPWKLKQKMGYRPPAVQPRAQNERRRRASGRRQSPRRRLTPTPTPAPDTDADADADAASRRRRRPSSPRSQAAGDDHADRAGEGRQVVGHAARPVLARVRAGPAAGRSRPIRPTGQTEDANSTAALLGLLGLFIVIGGISAVAWTRFRRYDDEQLAALINPDGKLPSMLDDQAVDLAAA